MARIPPLTPPYEPAVDAQLASMMPPGGPPIALFRTFVHNLPMTQAMGGWGRYELGKQLSLSLREREIVIDRTCARCGCEYEWSVHVAFFAGRAAFTDLQTASLVHGTSADTCWTARRERLLIDAVDALHDRADIDDELWAALAMLFERDELLDLLLLCGWYHAVAFTANAARVELEPGGPRFADYSPV
jgi:alkylhydroperoxidase family enzyme